MTSRRVITYDLLGVAHVELVERLDDVSKVDDGMPLAVDLSTTTHREAPPKVTSGDNSRPSRRP